MTHSKGISWFDDCRIPFVDGDTTSAGKRTCNIFETEYKSGGNDSPDYITDTRGRFPANLLVCDDMLNDGSTSKTNNGKRHNKTTQMFYGKGEHYYTGDAGTNSRYYDIDKWFDKIINYE